MIIRKQFKFEASHIVRDAVSERCKWSIHGHSYIVEVFLQGKIKENGMVLDFIEMKEIIGNFIDRFDHSIVLWEKDHEDYIRDMQNWSARWVVMSDNPTAENMARLFHYECQKVLDSKHPDIGVFTVRVHETTTGYAESEPNDLVDSNPTCIFS